MTAPLVKTKLGSLQPGDEVYEKYRGRVEFLGTVAKIEKNVPRCSITVSFTRGGGFSQNWAAKVLVRRAS